MSNGTTTPPATLNPPPDRHELQALLAQYHGLLTTIIQQLLPSSPDKPSLRSFDAETQELLAGTQELLAGLMEGLPGASVAFGEANAALNEGDHDDGLPDVGLAAEHIEPKRKGFYFNFGRFYGALKGTSSKAGFLKAAKHGMRAVKWGNIIAGSLSKEIKKVKGMEVILEFGEAVATTLEQVIEDHEAGKSD